MMDGRIGWMDGLIEMPGETAKILRRHVSSSHTHRHRLHYCCVCIRLGGSGRARDCGSVGWWWCVCVCEVSAGVTDAREEVDRQIWTPIRRLDPT